MVNVNYTDAFSLTSLAPPGVDGIVDSLTVRLNPLLTTVDFPVLTFVGQTVAIANNSALTFVSLPLLRSVSGQSFILFGNPSLVGVAVPQLISVEELILQSNAAIDLVNFPQLTVTSSVLRIWEHASLTLAAFPALLAIGGCHNCFSFAVSLNPMLTLVLMPNLTSIGPQFIYISENAELFVVPDVVHAFTGVCVISTSGNGTNPYPTPTTC